MYSIGERIVYGSVGVCEVVAIGKLDIPGAKKDVDYYTLSPLYDSSKVFAPVNTSVFTRPVLTREEALELIDRIPSVEGVIFENSNPRVLNEHYQGYLKSGDCMDLVRVIRAVYAKAIHAKERGRKLGQVDMRNMKKAEDMLHNELAVALGLAPCEVRGFIADRIAV